MKPFAFIRVLILFGRDETNFFTFIWNKGIPFLYWTILQCFFWGNWIFLNFTFWINHDWIKISLLKRPAYKFDGIFLNQLIMVLDLRHGAVSFWKLTLSELVSPNITPNVGSNAVFVTSMHFFKSIQLSLMIIYPTPDADTHSPYHNIPCFTVCTTQA